MSFIWNCFVFFFCYYIKKIMSYLSLLLNNLFSFWQKPKVNNGQDNSIQTTWAWMVWEIWWVVWECSGSVGIYRVEKKLRNKQKIVRVYCTVTYSLKEGKVAGRMRIREVFRSDFRWKVAGVRGKRNWHNVKNIQREVWYWISLLTGGWVPFFIA